MRQSLINPVIGKRVAVKPRQSFAGTEPKETVRVAHDLIDDVIREAVGDRISFQRQAFGTDADRNQEQADE